MFNVYGVRQLFTAKRPFSVLVLTYSEQLRLPDQLQAKIRNASARSSVMLCNPKQSTTDEKF